jgi:hypothetical protein
LLVFWHRSNMWKRKFDVVFGLRRFTSFLWRTVPTSEPINSQFEKETISSQFRSERYVRQSADFRSDRGQCKYFTYMKNESDPKIRCKWGCANRCLRFPKKRREITQLIPWFVPYFKGRREMKIQFEWTKDSTPFEKVGQYQQYAWSDQIDNLIKSCRWRIDLGVPSRDWIVYSFAS